VFVWGLLVVELCGKVCLFVLSFWGPRGFSGFILLWCSVMWSLVVWSRY